ncbi:hypothetical protein B0H10DRAFT_2188768 [Mycena sp. CBHHK59/15]|nr:hypothetical protein B0H10DRAFT_2188768 [Mycena sp. CBHHK59/15]
MAVAVADCCRATRISAGELDDERAPSAKGDGGGVDAAVVLQGQHRRGEGARGPETMASPVATVAAACYEHPAVLVLSGTMAMGDVHDDYAAGPTAHGGSGGPGDVGGGQDGDERGAELRRSCGGVGGGNGLDGERGRNPVKHGGGKASELGKKKLEVFGIRLNGSFGPKLPFSRLVLSHGVEGGRRGSGRAERVPADRIDGKRKIVPADINILIMIG